MNKHSLLLVEDDDSVSRLVTFLLQNEGYDVITSPDAKDAKAKLDDGSRPDLVILDLRLPDEDGVDLGRGLRARPGFERVPILALTARDQTVDRYEAFNAGFSGYLTKPFDPLELVYNIRALLHLATPGPEEAGAEIGPAGFRLAPAKFTVTTETGEITLTRLETAVLRYLMLRPREVYSAEHLAESVLGSSERQGGRTVDAIHAHIRNLRSKLEADPKEPTWIKTMGRRGYFFAG
jgi:DNA-binding response OmpR family regulator